MSFAKKCSWMHSGHEEGPVSGQLSFGSGARPALSIIRAIRSVTDKPILLIPHPVPGAQISTLDPYRWLGETIAPQAFAFIRELYRSELERFATQERLMLLRQSDETYD